MSRLTSVETAIDAAAHQLLDSLPPAVASGRAVEFLVFGLKQAWACLFGGLFLGLVLVTAFAWPAGAWLARYDVLFLAALGLQAAMLGLRLEQPEEVLVIAAFHVVGTAMEVFKTAHGSWAYPGPSLFHIGAVPLFSGFMYGAVGSYIARITRILDMRYVKYPPQGASLALAAAIYLNFFTHHYVWDARPVLFAATAILFWPCRVHYRVFRHRHHMPLLLGFALVALFIWAAENIGTWTGTWLYPHQKAEWSLVPVGKFGSWYLLMIISFVLVNVVHKPQRPSQTDPSLP